MAAAEDGRRRPAAAGSKGDGQPQWVLGGENLVRAIQAWAVDNERSDSIVQPRISHEATKAANLEHGVIFATIFL